MRKARLLAYVGLSNWLGGLSYAWWDNLGEGRIAAAVVNTVLIAGVLATLLVMGRTDLRRGEMVDDRDGRP